jgi:hypothetical protein
MITPEQIAVAGTESAHQKALFAFLALQSDPRLKLAFAIPNGGHRDKITAARMKAEGAKAGVWDIFLPFPAGGFHGLFIEMKVGDNKLTSKQEEFEAALHNSYAFKVCYSWEAAAAAMQEYVRCK